MVRLIYSRNRAISLTFAHLYLKNGLRRLNLAEIITPLEIPGDILTQIYGEARHSFPAECCGWLSGPAQGTAATTLRRCDNAQEAGGAGAIEGRTAERAYVIDGND